MDVRKKKHEKGKPCQVGGVGKKRSGGAGGGGGRGDDDSGNCDAVMLWCAQSGLAPAVGTATSGPLRQQPSRDIPTACLPQPVLFLTNSANKTHRHTCQTRPSVAVPAYCSAGMEYFVYSLSLTMMCLASAFAFVYYTFPVAFILAVHLLQYELSVMSH